VPWGGGWLGGWVGGKWAVVRVTWGGGKGQGARSHGTRGSGPDGQATE